LLFSCKDDEPTPKDPDVQKVCLVSQSDVNGYFRNYTYNAQKKIASVTDNFGNNQTFTYLSDTLVEEGELNPIIFSNRTRYSLTPDGRIKTITTEGWNPQPGFGLVQASITKQEYTYLANGSFSKFVSSSGTYFLDSATLRPLGTIRLRPNSRTEALYDGAGLLTKIENYFIDVDGAEWINSQETVTEYQSEEIGNANELTGFWLPSVLQSNSLFFIKPFYFGEKLPKVFESSGGFMVTIRTLNFQLNELNQVETIEEIIDNGFGGTFTNITNLQWTCL